MGDDSGIAERVIAMKRGQFSIKDKLAQVGEAKAEPPPQPGVASRAGPAAGPLPPPEAANGSAAAAAATLPSLDDLSPLPGPGDPYEAYARPANQMQPTLYLLRADASAKGFSYANFDTVDLLAGSDPGQGPVICLRFAGIVATEVRIAGRNPDFLDNYLGFHRIAWIRERSPSREFLPAEETVITGITFKKVEG